MYDAIVFPVNVTLTCNIIVSFYSWPHILLESFQNHEIMQVMVWQRTGAKQTQTMKREKDFFDR